MKISFISAAYIIIVIITLFLYYSINVSPITHWSFAFIPLFIPFFILLNFPFLIYWSYRKKFFFSLLSLTIILLGYTFFTRTYGINRAWNEKGEFQVLNYNVRIFNSYDHLKDEGYNSSKKMIKWIGDHEADIKCLQEFYNDSSSEIFRSIKKIKTNNPFYYFQPYLTVKKAHTFGLAIFSKHPIISKGQLKFQKGTFNQAIFADIKYKNDTIRIYNVHLQSMSIDEDSLLDSTSENNLKKVFYKLKKGALDRSWQVELLLEHIIKCPYKIILSGDLNDMPYSYTYEAFRKKLYNGFEEKGKGFGFTYNGKLFFLRIDNIFSDKRIEVNTFKTYQNITYSDHYPLEATYTFK